MATPEEVRSALRRFVGSTSPAGTMLAQVKAVDEVAATCTLEDEGLLYEDVRLRPVIDGAEAVTIFPKLDSWVLASRIEDDADWLVLSVQQAYKVKIKVATAELDITSGGVKIARGNDDMWSAIKLLIEAVEKIVVLQGTNPDFVKLAQAKTKFKNILNGT